MTTRIATIAMGGTIAMTPDATGGVVPTLTADDLVAAVPGLADLDLKITTRTLWALPSGSITFAHLAELVAAIRAEIADGAGGVVVTQGTDTIEETVFFLDLTVPGPEPVVVTGAMRHPSLAGPDGPANLLAAIQVAASPAARGLGGLVVFSDEVHAARLVRKTHTASTGAFVSPGFGPLGLVVEGVPRLLTTPGARPHVPIGPALDRVRVGVVPMALGDDGELLRRVGDGFDGLVLAGVGAGHVPDRVVPVVADVAARIPVVLASRAGAGAMLTHTYSYPGSEQDLIGRGLIPSGFLDPYKARVLLHLLLAGGADRTEIASTFERFG
ncbi:asparaginase [Actinophytocola sp.]|uniref:asparaginase n=1 Tax=Actinophytocola sp. TaxID=1872138 RepID=UPI002D7FFE56|nr:asparaginase [Actinophytocola sp.]HET9139729.1 asparaginase [Actinophytocola sp.]HEU5111472.1 asparaginase [Micromonosporaceae bacterium]